MGQQPIRSLAQAIILGTVLAVCLVAPGRAGAQQDYPEGYSPSEPAAEGGTNVLARFGAITTWMNDKLEAAGGNASPVCYRNCLTVPVNDILDCLEKNNTYETSESCERDAANTMAACDPKCQ